MQHYHTRCGDIRPISHLGSPWQFAPATPEGRLRSLPPNRCVTAGENQHPHAQSWLQEPVLPHTHAPAMCKPSTTHMDNRAHGALQVTLPITRKHRPQVSPSSLLTTTAVQGERSAPTTAVFTLRCFLGYFTSSSPPPSGRSHGPLGTNLSCDPSRRTSSTAAQTHP
jgi:hypothetical protein